MVVNADLWLLKVNNFNKNDALLYKLLNFVHSLSFSPCKDRDHNNNKNSTKANFTLLQSDEKEIFTLQDVDKKWHKNLQ